MLNIGITTAPRATNYLKSLLETIPETTKVILAPAVSFDLDNCCGYETMKPMNVPPGGGKPLSDNTDRLIEMMARRYPVFLTLQDDITPCVNAYTRIEQVSKWMLRNPRVAWVSFYTPYAECGSYNKPLWPYCRGFYGELAVLWNAKAGIEFVARSRRDEEHDLAIQRFFRSNRWVTYGHNPCLFQHVGVDSATCKSWEGGQRTSMNWNVLHDALLGMPLPS